MRKNKIEPKEIQIVYPYKNAEPSIILVKGVKGGKNFLNMDKPLFIYEENGKYTEQIKSMYEQEE